MFKAQFAQWGQDKQGELRQDIADLLADIGVLNDKLAKLRISLLALGVGLGAGLAAAGIGLALSGPVAPFILVSAPVKLDSFFLSPPSVLSRLFPYNISTTVK